MKITTSQYSQTLFELTQGKSEQEVLEVTKKFAEVLKNDGQIKNVSKIIEKFSELYNKANGIVEAEVVTAEEMGQEIKDKVEKFVKEKYQAREVVIKNMVDKDIRGGIVVRVGDEVMDGSIESQLKKLGKALSS